MPSRAPCLFWVPIPPCCARPQAPWPEGVPVPQPISPGRVGGVVDQWRAIDRAAPAYRSSSYPYARVRRQDGVAGGGLPTFEVELYDAQVMLRDVYVHGSRRVLDIWPEVLPGRPEKAERRAPDPACFVCLGSGRGPKEHDATACPRCGGARDLATPVHHTAPPPTTEPAAIELPPHPGPRTPISTPGSGRVSLDCRETSTPRAGARRPMALLAVALALTAVLSLDPPRRGR